MILYNMESYKKEYEVSGEHISEKIVDTCCNLSKSIVDGGAKAPEIEDFLIIKPISRGAFGKVFLGYKKTDPDKLFAIKVMRKSEMINKNMAHQVARERNALALSRSPYCVQLFYSLQTSTFVYLVMEYLIGGDLKSLLSIYGYFEEEMATFYVAEVILALQYLHKHGIIHRDIKPDNMLLTSDGHVRLTDFGLSHIPNQKDLEINDLVNASPNFVISRTPGQLLSLTSHLSFGSNENIAKKLNDSRLKSPSSIVGDNWSSQKDFSGIDPMISADDLNITHGETCYYSCVTCSQTEEECECKKKLEDSFHLKRSYMGNESENGFKDNSRKRMFSAEDSPQHCSHTGLTEQVNLMEIPSMFSSGTPKKKCIRNNNSSFEHHDNIKTPLRGVLKKCFSGDCQGRPVMVSTPVSAVLKRCNSDSISVPKKTRFNMDVQEQQVSEMEVPVSPIVTPKMFQGGGSTPLRTPKSVRRTNRITAVNDSKTLFGTPDYLAPEVLLFEPHGPEVDWWALGVCCYEFMVGILPFNSENLHGVFSNILERALDFPEGEEALSDNARLTIESLLNSDKSARANGDDLQKMALFEQIDWDNLYSINAPFVPRPEDKMDTSYFQARNELQNLKVSSCGI